MAGAGAELGAGSRDDVKRRWICRRSFASKNSIFRITQWRGTSAAGGEGALSIVDGRTNVAAARAANGEAALVALDIDDVGCEGRGASCDHGRCCVVLLLFVWLMAERACVRMKDLDACM